MAKKLEQNHLRANQLKLSYSWLMHK